jgi:hypothetical protein
MWDWERGGGGGSWPWSYCSLIYNYICNQCLSPLIMWVRISIRARCTTLCDKVCQWLATGRWFSQGPPVSSTDKTDHHDLTEILFKVALNTIKQTNKYMRLENFKKCILQSRFVYLYEEFEETKGVIRIRKSKKNRQHNGQKKKYKRTNNDRQNIHIKPRIE